MTGTSWWGLPRSPGRGAEVVGTTGLGSLPGTDVGAGVRLALEATPGLPWLPEFPGRGPWAGMVGRALGLLDGLGAGLAEGQWHLAAAPALDQRRARAALRDDLDLLEENAQGLTGRLKLSVCGPWTLAAATLLPLGGRVLGDRAARRDLAQALASGVGGLVAEVSRLLPGVEVVLQVDEPSLPAVLAGRVPTEGGYFRHRSVTPAEAVELLRPLGGHALHCCAPGLDPAIVLGPGGAGFRALSLDQDQVGPREWDALAASVESGADLWLGCVPTGSGGHAPRVDAVTRRALGALRPLALGPVLAERLVLTPACGLAGWSVREVPRLFEALRRSAAQVDEALRAG